MTDDPTLPKFSAALLDASAAEAPSALVSAGDHVIALVEQWIARSNVAALVAVSDHSSAPIRKMARRGLSVLRSRGIAIPEATRLTPPGLGTRTQLTAEAWMMAPDARGGVVMVLAQRAPTRRYRTAFIYLHDGLGIQRVESGEQSQHQLREAMARLIPGSGLSPVSVPVEWARYRVAAARKRHQELGHPPPLGLMTAAALLGPVPEMPPPHPLSLDRFSFTSEEQADLARQSGELHRLPEFRGWLPPRGAVDQMLAAIGEHVNPDQQPSQAEMGALLEGAVQAATDRLFSPQAREHLVETMRDSALSVLTREGEARARRVVGAMQAIRAAGLITNPPHEVGFLRAFFDKAVAILLSQGKGSLKIPVRRPAVAPTGAAEPAQDGESTHGLDSQSLLSTPSTISAGVELPEENGWEQPSDRT